MKAASLLVSLLFPSHPLPNEGVGPKADFGLLMTHLGIKEEVSGSDELEFFMFDMSFTKATEMIKYIISDYYSYDPDDDMFGKSTTSTRSEMMKLIKQPVLFQRPKLLKPPYIFRDLLKYYMKNDILCCICGKKPKRSAICLVCGALLCYEGGERGKEPNPCSLRNLNSGSDEIVRRRSGPIVK